MLNWESINIVRERHAIIQKAHEFLRANPVVRPREFETMTEDQFREHHITVRFWLAAMAVEENFTAKSVFSTLVILREKDCQLEWRRRDDAVRDARAIESLDHDRTSATFSVKSYKAALWGIAVSIFLAALTGLWGLLNAKT